MTEHFRETIKQLYLDQNKSLKEVMKIMDQDHAFHATSVAELYHRTIKVDLVLIPRRVKMYKSRITQWGFDKKNKASDMEFVLRKKMQRDAVHKSTSFIMRGRALNTPAFAAYVKRHHLLERIEKDAYTADTPEHISYQTPVTSPISQSGIDEPDTSSEKVDRQQNKIQDNVPASNLNVSRTPVLADRYYMKDDQETLSVIEPQDLYRWLFLEPNLARAIAPPEPLLTFEHLFVLTRAYVEGAFAKGVWAVNAEGTLINTTMTDTLYETTASQFGAHVIAS